MFVRVQKFLFFFVSLPLKWKDEKGIESKHPKAKIIRR